jgi:serine phosphatase RsbU (regulator of sigma subunit)/CHASE3 domain sensor protein
MLLSAAVWLSRTVQGLTAFESHVRQAQDARHDVLVAQLDQETSLRGFTSTHLIEFLEPYGRSQATIDQKFAELTDDVNAFGAPQLRAIVDDELALHRRWHTLVAAPLLLDPPPGRAIQLQRTGRDIVDRFRADDRKLGAAIDRAATTADHSSDTAFFRIAFVTGLLGLVFTIATLYVARQRTRILAETTRQRMLYENEKRIADRLQAAFVQKALPVIPNLGFHASYMPAGAEAQVGGDWYDAFELPDGRILFSIGDVAGHGIEAAVIMSRARQAIISNALHEADPAAVLRKANQTLMLQEPKMVTAICGYIEPKTLAIRYATAGHPPPVLAVPGREPFFLEHDGVPLGILSSATFGSFSVQASSGALLVLYTDGVIEHKRDLLDGERRLLDAARSAVDQHALDPASSVRSAIFGDEPPDDDVAIMTVSFAVNDRKSAATVNALGSNRLTVRAADPSPVPESAAPFQPEIR